MIPREHAEALAQNRKLVADLDRAVWNHRRGARTAGRRSAAALLHTRQSRASK